MAFYITKQAHHTVNNAMKSLLAPPFPVEGVPTRVPWTWTEEVPLPPPTTITLAEAERKTLPATSGDTEMWHVRCWDPTRCGDDAVIALWVLAEKVRELFIDTCATGGKCVVTTAPTWNTREQLLLASVGVMADAYVYATRTTPTQWEGARNLKRSSPYCISRGTNQSKVLIQTSWSAVSSCTQPRSTHAPNHARTPQFHCQTPSTTPPVAFC